VAAYQAALEVLSHPDQRQMAETNLKEAVSLLAQRRPH